MIDFQPLELRHRAMIEAVVRPSERRNCDFSFMNLFSWRFHYDTEVALHEGWLLFRFKADGHLAYQLPLGGSDYRTVLDALLDDALRLGHPFLMLGVCEQELPAVEAALPDHYFATDQRDYADYLYRRDALATLSGKHLQAKRNFANRFERLYPDYEIIPLGPERFAECLRLETEWAKAKTITDSAGYADESRSMEAVFAHWTELDAQALPCWSTAGWWLSPTVLPSIMTLSTSVWKRPILPTKELMLPFAVPLPVPSPPVLSISIEKKTWGLKAFAGPNSLIIPSV